MTDYQNEFIKELFHILKHKNIQTQIRIFMEPIVQLIVKEIYLYLMISIISILAIFIMIFIILLFMIKIYWEVTKK